MSNSSEFTAAPKVRKRVRLVPLLKNLALSATSLIVFVLLLELVLHLMGYGNVEIYEADPALFWRLKPRQHCYTKIDHKPVHINAQGTRGPEFQPDKPTNTLRIVSLGDSKTFGWGLAEPETYSDRLEKRLQEQVGSGKKVEVINAGVNAWSYSQMLVFFRDRALRYKPDMVILADANLWTQFSETNDPQFVKQFMRRVWLKNLLRRSALYHFIVEVQLKETYERYRIKFMPVDPQQDTLFKEQQKVDPDAVFRRAIEQLCQTALSQGVKPVLLYIPVLDDTEDSPFVRILKVKTEISRKLKIPLVDMTPVLKPQGKALYLVGDPVHLNAEGNRMVADHLFKTLSAMVSP